MPGVLMALGRLNRPGLMVYGGTIRPGSCASMPGTLDIVSAFQSYGRYLSEGETEEAEKIRYDTVRNACPGSGACGGMYSKSCFPTPETLQRQWSHCDQRCEPQADSRCLPIFQRPTLWHRALRRWV